MQTDALGAIYPTLWFDSVFCSRHHLFIPLHSPNILSGVYCLHIFTLLQLQITSKGLVQGTIPSPLSFLQELRPDFKDFTHVNHPVNTLQ